MKKILYIAFKYEYGKKGNGLAVNYKGWYENFVKLDYEVRGLFYEEYSKLELQNAILETAKTYKPDLIFFILQASQIEISTLKSLQQEGFFTVNFFGDDQWRFSSFSSHYGLFFSAIITTDKFSLKKYLDLGQNRVIRSQWASIEGNRNLEKEDYKYTVSFIGGVSRYRKWFISKLRKNGIHVDCFGEGWENGRVSYEQMEYIFSTSKINLNISNSTNYDLRYLLSKPKEMAFLLKSKFLKTSKNSSQLKARNFEIPVQGGFQLTDYVPSLGEYFEIDKEVVCYNNVDEAIDLIKYYLVNSQERESIKEKGIERARGAHTFRHRIIDFMSQLEKIREQDVHDPF